MPIYCYKCSACGGTMEKIQKFSDAELTDCPQCNTAHTLIKQLSVGTGFNLKGYGYHKNGMSFSKS